MATRYMPKHALDTKEPLLLARRPSSTRMRRLQNLCAHKLGIGTSGVLAHFEMLHASSSSSQPSRCSVGPPVRQDTTLGSTHTHASHTCGYHHQAVELRHQALCKNCSAPIDQQQANPQTSKEQQPQPQPQPQQHSCATQEIARLNADQTV